MAKVQIVEEKPSEQIIKAANKVVTVKDSLGRSIEIRKPPQLSEYQLLKVIGDENDKYIQAVMPLIWVVSIDGVSVIQPRTPREVDALIQRLDEEGINAVIEKIKDMLPKKPTPETIKNAQGTPA